MPRIAVENQCGMKDEKTGLTCARQKGHPQPDKHKNKDFVWYGKGDETPVPTKIIEPKPEPKPKRSQRTRGSGLKLDSVVKAVEKMEKQQPGFTKSFLSMMGKNKTPEDLVKRMKKSLKNVGD